MRLPKREAQTSYVIDFTGNNFLALKPRRSQEEELNAQMKQSERFEEQAERESQEQAPFDARERQTPQGKRARVGVKRVTEVEDAVIVDEISHRS